MNDQRDGRDGEGSRRHEGDRPDGQTGPMGTEFLELELSRMLFSRAADVAKEVAIDILREAVRERLRERIGEQLAAIGRLAADELADDVAANLEIEARIAARMESALGAQGRLRAAVAHGASAPAQRPAPASRRRRAKR